MKPGFPFSSGTSRDAALRKTLSRAMEAVGAERWPEALRMLESDPAALNSPVGQNIRGDILLRRGDAAAALSAFEVAIRLSRQMPEAHANRGVALQVLGRLEDALAAEEQALRLRPGYALAHFNRGNILRDMGRVADAAAAYGRALAAQPTFAEAALNRGLSLMDGGNALEALGVFSRALVLRPKYVAALAGQAIAARELGDFRQAFAAIDAALAIEPDNRDILLARGDVLLAAERAEEALAHADALVDRFPASALPHVARSAALWRLDRMEESLAAAEEAIRTTPEEPSAHTAHGIALTELGRLHDALSAFDRARALGAPLAEFQHYRALAIGDLGNPAEAVAFFDQALAETPDDARARTHRGYVRLAAGDYPGGFADHEARLVYLRGHAEMQRTAPRWQGQDIAGKRLLVYAEQGLGDTIMFTRYVPLLAAAGAKLTLHVQRPLVGLYRESIPFADVTDALGARTGFDYQVPFMSLAHIFGTTVETVPDDAPYLHADTALVAKWRSRIGGEGLKVGIVWQGNRNYRRDRLRSIPVTAFAPLASVPGVRLISFQTARPAEQLKAMPEDLRRKMQVETLGDEIVNNPDGFREVAAAMHAVDVMVTSDTGPAHLAGALARPILVALATRPDWRWMRAGEATPWYPSMRLVRQEQPEDWADVFQRIAGLLEDMQSRRNFI